MKQNNYLYHLGDGVVRIVISDGLLFDVCSG